MRRARRSGHCWDLQLSVPGRSLELPSGIPYVVISPNNDYALAMNLTDAQPGIIQARTLDPALLPLTGVHSNAGLIAISPEAQRQRSTQPTRNFCNSYPDCRKRQASFMNLMRAPCRAISVKSR